jgi:hypothetical protein
MSNRPFPDDTTPDSNEPDILLDRPLVTDVLIESASESEAALDPNAPDYLPGNVGGAASANTLIRLRLADAARAIAAAQEAFNAAVAHAALAMNQKIAAAQAAALKRTPPLEMPALPPDMAGAEIETAEQAVVAANEAVRQATAVTDAQLAAATAADDAVITAAQLAAEQSVAAAEQSIGAAVAATEKGTSNGARS